MVVQEKRRLRLEILGKPVAAPELKETPRAARRGGHPLEGAAAEVERIRFVADDPLEQAVGHLPAEVAQGRERGRRQRSAGRRSFRLLDPSHRQGARRLVPESSQRLDRGGPRRELRPFVARQIHEPRSVVRGAAAGDRSDGLHLEVLPGQRVLEHLAHLFAGAHRLPGASEFRPQPAENGPTSVRVLRGKEPVDEQFRGAGIVDPIQGKVRARRDRGRVVLLEDCSNRRQRFRPFQPPGQADHFGRAVRGGRFVLDVRKGVVRGDRIKRGEGDRFVLPAGFERPFCGVREELCDVFRFPVPQRLPQGLQIEPVPPVPPRGQLQERFARLGGSHVGQGEDELAPHAGVRIDGQGQDFDPQAGDARLHRPRRFRGDDGFPPGITDQDAQRQLANPRVRILQGREGVRPSGPGKVCQDEQAPRPFPRPARPMEIEKRFARRRAARQERLPRCESRCDVRGLERLNQSRLRSEIGRGRLGFRPGGLDAVDPSGGLVGEAVPADAGVVPVADVHRPVGRHGGVDRAEPAVPALEQHTDLASEGRPVPLERMGIHSAGSGIELQDRSPVGFGKQIALVDQDSAGRAVAGADDLRHDPREFLRPQPAGVGELVSVIPSVHDPNCAASAFAVVVVVGREDVAERIHAGLVVVSLPVSQGLEPGPVEVHAERGPVLIAPETSPGLVRDVERDGASLDRVQAVAGVALREVEFAVRPQRHAVDAVVAVDPLESGQEREPPVGPVVAVGVLQDQQVGGVPDVHARPTVLARLPDLLDGQPHRHREDVGRKDRRLVRPSVSVRIREDLDPVGAGHALEGALLPEAVVQPFGDPDPAARIDVHARRVAEQRLVGPQRNFESLGGLQGFQRFFGGNLGGSARAAKQAAGKETTEDQLGSHEFTRQE